MKAGAEATRLVAFSVTRIGKVLAKICPDHHHAAPLPRSFSVGKFPRIFTIPVPSPCG
jgi:hypothetical protein